MDSEAKLQFLDTAASAYALTAPALSAHIMSTRAAIAEELGIARLKKEVRNACAACGTIAIPGITSKMSINKGRTSGTTSKESKGSIASKPNKAVTTETTLDSQCLSCHRVSKVALPPSKRQTSKSYSALQTPWAPGKASNPLTSEAAANLANVSSRQRTRERKKAGLQALVERSKETRKATSAFGLDLMDLMKEG